VQIWLHLSLGLHGLLHRMAPRNTPSLLPASKAGYLRWGLP
jgi:hypothetical protein